MTQQFCCDKLYGQPASVVGKKVLGLRQQSALELLRTALTCTLHGQSSHVLLIAGCGVPCIDSRKTSFGGNSSQRDENLTFKPILGWSIHTLSKLANTKIFAIW